jgi:predicted nuclease of restriction endonuclease-like (RecB) superfamily
MQRRAIARACPRHGRCSHRGVPSRRKRTPVRAIPRSRASLPPGYRAFLDDLKVRIRAAQIRAVLAVNSHLVLLYWRLGRDILVRQRHEGWGAHVIDRLGADLRKAFPEMQGFSPRNLKYMRAFAEAWPDEEIVQQAVAQLPWGHNVRLLDRLRSRDERLWYVRQAVAQGWSRATLEAQIETGLHARVGTAVTNFETTLPPPHSDLAQQTLKDPYVFDFLTVGSDAQERDLERGLVEHLRDFLLELGVGFAFVGSQVRLEVGGEDFYIDLLFFHLQLRCFVVIELKSGEFKPEYAGKMNFYLSAVDAQLRREGDQPSIGLVLCKEKNRVVVEYALRDTKKPIGVAAYRLLGKLPSSLLGSLPTVEELEAELARTSTPPTTPTATTSPSTPAPPPARR